MTNQSLREMWDKFVATLPSLVRATPKEAVADWWLTRRDEEMKEWVEKLKEMRDKTERRHYSNPTSAFTAFSEVISLLEEKIEK